VDSRAAVLDRGDVDQPNLLIYREPSFFPSQITADHYLFVLTRTPFLVYVRNSMLVTLVTTSLALVIGTLAAYAITRLSFRGRRGCAFGRGDVSGAGIAASSPCFR